MFIHQLTKSKYPTKKGKRVGRGRTRGKTSGRGIKGQNSRAGSSKRPHERDLLKKIPKLRGHGKNRSHTVVNTPKSVAINLKELSNYFKDGELVNPSTLYEKGMITLKVSNQKNIKILAFGELKIKVSVVGIKASDKAKAEIVKLGGSVS